MERPVVIEEYTTDCALQFKEERKLLKGIMGDTASTIEYIGSTSVEGLEAKPILDIMIGVHNLKEIDVFIEPKKRLHMNMYFIKRENKKTAHAN